MPSNTKSSSFATISHSKPDIKAKITPAINAVSAEQPVNILPKALLIIQSPSFNSPYRVT